MSYIINRAADLTARGGHLSQRTVVKLLIMSSPTIILFGCISLSRKLANLMILRAKRAFMTR